MKNGNVRLAMALLLVLFAALLVLPGVIKDWHGTVVPPDGTTSPLKVDLSSLASEIVATGKKVPWNIVYTLANISNAAYDDWPIDESQRASCGFCRWGFKEEDVEPVPGGRQYAYVLSNDDVVVVAFRGTDDWDDFKKDTWCVSDVWHGGNVHSGFLLALADVEKKLVPAVRKHGASRKRLWITGHSLGGAMAFIFACKCAVEHRLTPSGVVTFGQPRCFDRAVCDLARKELLGRYVRIVNEDDIVPWLPPPVVLPFIHTGARFGFFDGKVNFIDYTTICAAPADKGQPTTFDGEKRISAKQYSDLNRNIQQAKRARPKLTMAKGPMIGTSIRQLATMIPEIRDHLMDNYLASIQSYSRAGVQPHRPAPIGQQNDDN